MTEDGVYAVQHDGFEFLVYTENELPVCLTVYPIALEESDTRMISVTKTVDTETGDVDYQVVLPPEIRSGEHQMWGVGVVVASWWMANTEGDDL